VVGIVEAGDAEAGELAAEVFDLLRGERGIGILRHLFAIQDSASWRRIATKKRQQDRFCPPGIGSPANYREVRPDKAIAPGVPGVKIPPDA